MRKISLLLLFFLASACPATAQMTGYSINTDTGLVTAFSCYELGDPDCFNFTQRTELGTIDVPLPFATTLAPTGELVIVDQTYGGDISLVWLDLPSLDILSSLTVVGEVDRIGDVAFGADGTVWITGWDFRASGCFLYTVDPTTGEASEVWNYPRDLVTIAFVGERMFMMAETELLEFDPVTGVERIITDYYWPGPYGGSMMSVPSLSSYDGRLWSLSCIPNPAYGGHIQTRLGTHGMQSGDYDVVVDDFDWIPSDGSNWWTLDLVDSPEQQPAAIPMVGRSGLAILVGLIGFVGAFLARRAF